MPSIATASQQGADRRPELTEIFLLAAWFALVTGPVEGAGLLIFQRFGWLNWNMWITPVALNVLWVSSLVDLALFVAVGIVLAVAGLILPKVPWRRIAFFVFALCLFFDWLGLTGRIRLSAMAILAAGLASVALRWFRKREERVLSFVPRSIPWLAAVVAILALGTYGHDYFTEQSAENALAVPPKDAPNIIVVVLDTTRADHMSAYGYARPTTPALEAFARQGVLFENPFSTSSWTLPSHASLLTGLWPHEHGAQDSVYRGNYPNIAVELRKRGYRTGAFSANFYFFCRFRGFGNGFIHFDDIAATAVDSVMRAYYPRLIDKYVLTHFYQDLPGRRRAEEINRAFLDWRDKRPERPFFAFLNYLDAHDPYLPPAPYRSKFSKLSNPGGIVNEREGRIHPQMSPEQLQSEIDAYDGAIAYMDHAFGELLAELERRGLSNTIVVLTADHGESLGEHGLFMHRNALYRELIRVPLVVRGPGHVPAGVRVDLPVTNASVPATLLELLDHREETVLPGPSLVPLWTSTASGSDWPFPLSELSQVPEWEWRFNPNHSATMKAVVTPQWHFVLHEKNGPILFDWRQDPAGNHDLAGSPEGQRVDRTLTQCLHQNQRLLRESNCPVEARASQ